MMPSNRKGSIAPISGHDDVTLSQARWSDHRAKIGLKSVTSFSADPHMGYKNRQEDFVNFVRRSFKMRVCRKFMQEYDPKKPKTAPALCHCGGTEADHWDDKSKYKNHTPALNVEPLIKQQWDEKSAMQDRVTNAFGKIRFIKEGLGSLKPAKYVRVRNNSDIKRVVELLNDKWHMSEPCKPSLIITVIGGAKNFKLDGKKKETFNRGLVNAAKTTHAWLITSGFDMGVMKAVGEAVREGQSFNWDNLGMTHSLRCIGIAPWGYVKNNHSLVAENTALSQGCWPASYKVSTVVEHGSTVSLNPDHTHFILVDDGYRGKYRSVAGFRSSLEKLVSLPESRDGLGIPVVLLVVEGGYDAIKDTHTSLKQSNIPVVICEGTGRAADIIAFADQKHTYENVTTADGKTVRKRQLAHKYKEMLKHKLFLAFGETWTKRSNVEEEIEKYTKLVLECCENENLITVFDMNREEDLDYAILKALLKGQGAENEKQLRLAFTWDRSDIAEAKIFTSAKGWPAGFLDEMMTEALNEDKVNFVKLLLQNGIVMKDYLTVPRLRLLYNRAHKSSHLRSLLPHRAQTHSLVLRDVAKLLKKLMGKYDSKTYTDDCEPEQVDKDSEYVSEKTDMYFDKPYRELLLWAVLMNRQEMACFLWERGDEALPTAIAASRIYGALSDTLPHYDVEKRATYDKHQKEFEQLAVKVLNICHQTDHEKAAMLIERKYQNWNDMTCLDLAADADAKELLSTPCCQNSLNLMWKRGIHSGWPKILAALLCPILVLIVRFQGLGYKPEEMSIWEKYKIFFRAPVVTFMTHVGFYMLFLIFYSYVILFDFREKMTTLEWVMLGWNGSLLMEELREMLFRSSADTLYGRIIDWWNFSLINRLDVFQLALALLALILRLADVDMHQVKTVYCINCVLLFIRILRDYSASSYLGPKLVMITKMMKELQLYIMILMVFLLAYGISMQAIMFPVREAYSLIFRDIFYYPYWHIYGELFLEELEGTTDVCKNTTGESSSGPLIGSDGSHCPRFSWLVPALTAGYLLIGNVLLLNLLIAIFTHVFEEIQTNSIQIWKFGMYYLVMEYDNKSGLPPPFIVLHHVAMFIKFLFIKMKCIRVNTQEPYTNRHKELLQIFEKEMLRTYLYNKEHEERMKTDIQGCITRILNKVNEMGKTLDESVFMQQRDNAGDSASGRELNTPDSTAGQGAGVPGGSRPSTGGGGAGDLAGLSLSRQTSTERKQALEPIAENPPRAAQLAGLLRNEEGRQIVWSVDGEGIGLDATAPATQWPPIPQYGSNTAAATADTKSKKQKIRPPITPYFSQAHTSSDLQTTEDEESAPDDEDSRLTAAYRSARDQLSSVDGGRFRTLEQRVIQLEEKTSMSLYNIEALLRKAVFQGASGAGHHSRSFKRKHRSYHTDDRL